MAVDAGVLFYTLNFDTVFFININCFFIVIVFAVSVAPHAARVFNNII